MPNRPALTRPQVFRGFYQPGIEILQPGHDRHHDDGNAKSGVGQQQ